MYTRGKLNECSHTNVTRMQKNDNSYVVLNIKNEEICYCYLHYTTGCIPQTVWWIRLLYTTYHYNIQRASKTIVHIQSSLRALGLDKSETSTYGLCNWWCRYLLIWLSFCANTSTCLPDDGRLVILSISGTDSSPLPFIPSFSSSSQKSSVSSAVWPPC